MSAKSSVWPKYKAHSQKKTGTKTEQNYFVTPSFVTPLYVNRITQARLRLAQHRVAQVSFTIGLPKGSNSEIATHVDFEIRKKKRQNIRERRKERLAKGPRIDPEKLRKINQEWLLFYGFKSCDIFHMENELDNIVSKVPGVLSKKKKAIQFDNCVSVIYIEKNNTGRRMSRWEAPRRDSVSSSELTSHCKDDVV